MSNSLALERGAANSLNPMTLRPTKIAKTESLENRTKEHFLSVVIYCQNHGHLVEIQGILHKRHPLQFESAQPL